MDPSHEAAQKLVYRPQLLLQRKTGIVGSPQHLVGDCPCMGVLDR